MLKILQKLGKEACILILSPVEFLQGFLLCMTKTHEIGSEIIGIGYMKIIGDKRMLKSNSYSVL